MVNTNILRGKIAENGLSQRELAKKIGLAETTLSRKISGEKDFKLGEAEKICKALGITDNRTKAQIFLA